MIERAQREKTGVWRRLIGAVPISLWPWICSAAAITIVVLLYGLFIVAISMND